VPANLVSSPLNTPDRDAFACVMVSGAPCTDAPVDVNGQRDWFLHHVGGEFTGLYFADGNGIPQESAFALSRLRQAAIPVKPLVVMPSGKQDPLPYDLVAIEDTEGWLAQRFDATSGCFYLLRPDQHVCGRWRKFEPDWVAAAVARATCNA